MNALMEAEEFAIAAYERSNVGGLAEIARKASQFTSTSRDSVATHTKFQPYVIRCVERHALEIIV